MEIVDLTAKLLVCEHKANTSATKLVDDVGDLRVFFDDDVRLVDVDKGRLFHVVRK